MPFSRSLSLEANPDVTNNFTWTRNGMVYTGNVSATSIYIPVFTKVDAGLYTVTARNVLGSAIASFAVNYGELCVFNQCLVVMQACRPVIHDY